MTQRFYRVLAFALMGAAIVGMRVPSEAAVIDSGLFSGLTSNSWTEVGSNSFDDVAYTRAEHDALVAATGSPGFYGVEGPQSAIEKWGGAGFDPVAGRMYFTGGGHHNYGGNEIYQFDLNSNLWTRLTDPAPYTGRNLTPQNNSPYPAPAEGPISAHTYDGVVWSEATNSLWIINSGATFDLNVDGSAPANYATWEFDPTTLRWIAHPESIGNRYPASTYVANIGEVWAVGTDHTKGTIVDPNGNVRDTTITGEHTNAYGLGTMAYDDATGDVYFVRTAYGNAVTRLSKVGGTLVSEDFTTVPIDVLDAVGGGTGTAIRDGKIWLWGGGGTLANYDPSADQWHIVETTGSAPAPSGAAGPAGAYGKFYYWAEQDAFVGANDASVWVFKPGDDIGQAVDPNRIRAEVTVGGETRQYGSIQEAFDNAADGATVRILPGTYQEGAVVRANDLKIIANGVHLDGAAVEGKGALVIKGKNTTITGLEVSGVAVSSANGAAIRMEGENLTLHGVYFHDSEQGILGGGGTILIEDSRFERLGKDGRAHGLYIDKDTEALIIHNSQFLDSKSEGHEIKSRAKRTEIYDSIVDSGLGNDSRLIDISNGGVLIIQRSTLREGPNSANSELIGYGYEPFNGGLHETSLIILKDNTIENDAGGTRVFLGVGSQTTPQVVLLGAQDFDNIASDASALLAGEQVFSDSFEPTDVSQTGGGAPTLSDMATNWTVQKGEAAVVANDQGMMCASASGHCLQVSGDTELVSNAIFGEGSYLLSFELLGEAADHLALEFGNYFDDIEFTGRYGQYFRQVSVGPDGGAIRFRYSGSGSLTLDNIVVYDLSALEVGGLPTDDPPMSVHEPGPLVMSVIGLVMLAWFGAKRGTRRCAAAGATLPPIAA